MRTSPVAVRFLDLCAVCEHYFGEARQQGGSPPHLQDTLGWRPAREHTKGRGGKAKPYQVKQVLAAIAKLEEKP